MTYADTDFFLAILKNSDWLKENADIITLIYGDSIYLQEYKI